MTLHSNYDTDTRPIYPGLTIGEAKCSRIVQRFDGKYKDAPLWKSPSVLKSEEPNTIQVYLIKKIKDEECTEFCIKVLDMLLKHKVKIFVQKNTLEEIEEETSKSFKSQVEQYTEEQEMNIDLLVIIGGDGTIMYALKDFQNRVAPIVVAFSQGTLNYLANFSVKDYENNLNRVITAIREGQVLEIEKRYRLHCELVNEEKGNVESYHALNEVLLGSAPDKGITTIECSLEGKYFATFEGDGVMVSTPTGSTAYQLSAGGPIINHLMSCMTISQIAGLTLSTRTVVLPSAVKLTFKLKPAKGKKAILNMDGQVKHEVDPRFSLNVTGSEFYVPFVVGEKKDTLDNWIFRLRYLLGWNRNYSDYKDIKEAKEDELNGK